MKLLKPLWIAKEGHPIFSIDIHPDCSRFATGGQGNDSGRIVIWNMKALICDDESIPTLLCQMDHHLACVNCVRWSNSGKYLASGGDDKLVMIWEKSQYGGGGTVFGGGGKVNVESWRCKYTLRRHEGDILDLAWSNADSLLATASVDNSVIVWNGEKFPEVIKILRGHTGFVKGVVFDPVGKYLASQSDDKSLRLWRTSDWEVDSIITEPFEESGATTHFLRPGWSPDGSFLVSAHSMNGGGPTAQIIDRQGWKKVRDFVGHKKAVCCVRFHNSIFQKESGKSEFYVTVALGSRDRGFSVWSTNLKRPYFVVNDVFDQSVLDLSWRRNVLLACSKDGSVAAVVMDEKELGRTLSEGKTYDFMSKTYGKSFGQKPKTKTNGVNLLLAENPEALKAEVEEDLKPPPTNGNSHKVKPKGPTDKQIEARTLDGHRRITPVFIPIPMFSNGGAPLGSGEFGSSSSKERSKIPIEKRNELVKPNISPIKSNTDSNSAKEPPVNLIAVKRKPKLTNGISTPNTSEEPAKFIPVKKKLVPIEDSSDSSSSSVSSSSSSSDSQETTPSEKPKEAIPKKPQLVVKRKIADSGTDKSSSDPSVKKKIKPWDNNIESQSPIKSGSSYRLCPLSLKSSSHVYSFPDSVCVSVSNEFKPGISKLTVKTPKVNWNTLFSGSIVSVLFQYKFLVIALEDSSLNLYSVYEGLRLLPPLMLPSPISKIVAKSGKLALITTQATFYLWEVSIEGRLRILLRNETLLPFIQGNKTISKLSFVNESSQPLIVTSDGKAFAYSEVVGSWLKLSDCNDRVSLIADIQGPPIIDSVQLPNARKKLKPSDLLEDDEEVRLSARIAFCESQSTSALYLNSPEDYKYWTISKVRHLCSGNADLKLKSVLTELLGPCHESSGWEPFILGIDKRTLLKQALKVIGGCMKHQKLFVEFNDQLSAENELEEATKFIDEL